jgi:MerR family transcriptional regulator, repressor of the yfmOP operon
MPAGQAVVAPKPAGRRGDGGEGGAGGAGGAGGDGLLLSIGAAAQRTGVSQRALRYYQQLGLLTPCGCTPGGLRRYSQDDLDRVGRIRQLQTLLGLNLDEIAIVLRSEDRLAEIRRAFHDEETTSAERLELVRESLDLQQDLRATVEAKRQGIEGFLNDLDARIGKTRAILGQMADPAAATSPPARRPRRRES